MDKNLMQENQRLALENSIKDTEIANLLEKLEKCKKSCDKVMDLDCIITRVVMKQTKTDCRVFK